MTYGHRRVTRQFVAAAAVALAAPAITVMWLGWLLLRSDQELDRQRVQERLDAAAGLVVGALERALTATDQRLVAVAGSVGAARQAAAAAFRLGPADGTIVVFEGEATWTSAPLAWHPGDAAPDDSAALAFLDAEALEFRGDLAGAAATYRALSRSTDAELRAGALAREARVARKRGRVAEALAAYDALASMADVRALGRAADLVGRFERLTLLKELGDDARVVAEARALDDALVAGRWRLARSQFDFYRLRVTPLRGAQATSTTAPAPTSLALAEAVSSAAEAIAAADPRTGSAREPWDNTHGRGVVAWRRAGDRVAALVATEAWVQRAWLADVRAIAQGQRARVSLTTSDDREWLDHGLAGLTLRRSAGDTGLPFTVRVASADPTGESSTFTSRRRLLAGIVTALALLMSGAGYVAARGLAREVAAARLQSDFVAAVSHEFRTPVASVRQLIELLDDGRVADDTKRHEYYGRIRRQAARLQRLVENLLDFGRMEAGAAEYRRERLDPADVVRDVTREFQGEGRGSGRRVDVVMPESLPPIDADREALGRAVWNLLDNAAKYSPADAPIRVEVARTPGGVSITVRDQGPGIPVDEQRRIFDRFVRGAQARDSGAKGTGLGLAMVRHIARAHGGDVSVHSEPGRGSTFTLAVTSIGSTPRRVDAASGE